MPNGLSRPEANTLNSEGFAAPLEARIARTRFPSLSATKISPFGAVRTTRGPVKPEANNSAVKPRGTFGDALSGRFATIGKLVAAAVAFGAGISSIPIFRRTPGRPSANRHRRRGRKALPLPVRRAALMRGFPQSPGPRELTRNRLFSSAAPSSQSTTRFLGRRSGPRLVPRCTKPRSIGIHASGHELAGRCHVRGFYLSTARGAHHPVPNRLFPRDPMLNDPLRGSAAIAVSVRSLECGQQWFGEPNLFFGSWT